MSGAAALPAEVPAPELPGVALGQVAGLDPRLRLVAAAGFAFTVVACRGLPALAAGLVLALATAWAARLPLRATVRRVLAMDALIVLLIVMLPFTVPGEAILRLGPLTASREGMVQATAIAAKAHAVILALLALVGTLEAPRLGHAMGRLGAPDKLVHLLLFTLRYVGVIEAEYRRLRLAMKARAFRPRSDRHTWQSYGYLVGMLLVRSFDRSERILAAMKCRGFTGRFHPGEAGAWRSSDTAFAALWLLALAGLIAIERG